MQTETKGKKGLKVMAGEPSVAMHADKSSGETKRI